MSNVLKWYEKEAPENNIIISSRIRLARNLSQYPFPCKMDSETKQKVIEAVKAAIANIHTDESTRLSFIDMGKLSKAAQISLVEKHLVSPEFIKEPDNKAVIVSEDESICIMINEEDHLRIQVMESGLQLDKALQTAMLIDDVLDESLNYAFDEKLGYLTQCPTNLGTGLRASLMLHLPALGGSSLITRLASTISKLGLTIRGTYGEGSKANNYYYQISNQVTLGIDEKAAIENLSNISKQVISQEIQARENLISDKVNLEDKVWRSYGILQNARILSYDELLSCISNIRLGIAENILTVKPQKLNSLMLQMGGGTLMDRENKELTPYERDIIRATEVRKVLGA